MSYNSSAIPAMEGLADFTTAYLPGGILDHIHIEDAVKAFTEGVKDPLNPTLCAHALTACVIVCRTGTTTYVELLRTKYPHLYSAAAHLVSVIRPHDPDLEAKYTTCKCPISSDAAISKLHQVNITSPNGYTVWGNNLATVFSWTNLLLQNCLSRGRLSKIHKEGYHTNKAAKKNVLQPWPFTVRDIVPRGGPTTIEIIVEWMGAITCTNFVTSVGNYLYVCPSLVMDTISSSEPFPTRVYECAKAVLERWRPIIKVVPLSQKLTTGSHRVLTVEEEREFQLHVNHIGIFVRAFLMHATEAQLLRFAKPHGKEFIQILSELLDMVQSPSVPQSVVEELEPTTSNFSRYCAITFALLKLIKGHQFELNESIVSLVIYYMGNSSGTKGRGPFFIVHDMLLTISYSQRCHLEGCTESFESAGRSFDLCGGCRVARYCCKGHQRCAWAKAPEKHKDICKKLKLVTGGLGIVGALEEQIPTICAKAQVNEAIGRDVVEYYSMRWGLVKL